MDKRLKTILNIIFIVSAAILIGLFLFLRFYKIDTSLFFFNDIGRDFWVLYNWYISGKPPLLGPQNSVLPFNQSAIYYYLFYPAFLLTKMSPFTTLYTNAVVYIICFFTSLIIAKTDTLRIVTLIVFALIVVHPQVIIQNRFVWNPSLVPPFLLLATISFLKLFEKWSRSILILSAFSLAAAVSMSFSIAPVFLSFWFTSIIIFRKKCFKYILYSFLAVILLNSLTILFEIKYSFLLTKALLRGNFPTQVHLGFWEKIADLNSYIFSGSPISWILIVLFILILLVMIWQFISKIHSLRGLVNLKFNIQNIVLILFLFSLLFTIISPIDLQAHYIFGILVLMFSLIATLPVRFSLIAAFIYLSIWLQPSLIRAYFKPAPRTIAQLENCFANICKLEKDPLFVSVQSNFHPYHNGPEFRYLMAKNGCDVQPIEEKPTAASKMAVVVDSSTFELGKTKYLELSEFNPSKEINLYSCDGNIQVHMLQK